MVPRGSAIAARNALSSRRIDGTISRIDPTTNTVVDTIPVVATPFVASSAFGSVWVGDFGGTQLWRINP